MAMTAKCGRHPRILELLTQHFCEADNWKEGDLSISIVLTETSSSINNESPSQDHACCRSDMSTTHNLWLQRFDLLHNRLTFNIQPCKPF